MFAVLHWQAVPMERLLRKTLPGGRFDGVNPDRSALMSRIRGKGNRSTERRFRMALVRSRVCGWSLHPKSVTGRPDFYFSGARVAVFLDGCFWHGCPVCGHIPRTRTRFWRAKITRNRNRSRAVKRELNRSGIAVVRIWEHELKRGMAPCLKRVIRMLRISR